MYISETVSEKFPVIKNPFKDWNRDFKLLAAAIFANGVYFGIRLTLYNNFIVERLGLEAHQLGYIESLRELPGFLNVLFIALMIRLPPQIVGGVSMIVMGVGIGAFAELTTISQLTLFSLIGSTGFLEIAVNRRSATEELGIGRGSAITIE